MPSRITRSLLWAAVGCIMPFFIHGQCSYSYSKTITIDNTLVSGTSDLTDFPLLVTFTLPQLATTANGGGVENINGYDIRFLSVDCACWLDHQIESYNPVTGQYAAWVRVPTLKYSENTLIEMYYGNAVISTDPSTDRTWTSDYVGVWHLDEDPQGTGPQHTDASGTGNHGTAEGGVSIVNVTGKIGNAVSFDGTNDLIEVPDDPTLDLTTSLTLSLWFDLDGVSADMPGGTPYPTLLGKGQSFNTDNGYGLLAGDTRASTAAGMIANPGRVITSDLALADFNDGNWHHLVATYNGTSFELYFDGNPEATVNTTMTINTQNNPLHIGDGLDDGHWNGKIDEVRISNAPRSAAWIATEFNNINDPASFYAIGNQKEADCSGPGGVGLMDGTSNLVLWLKADCGAENTNNGSLSDGQEVAVWRDQSGYGRDATEATNRPDYQINQINGQPAINFTAANGDRLLSSGVNDADEFMIFIVAEANSYASNNIGLLHGSDGQGFSTVNTSKSIGMWVSNTGNFWGRLVQANGNMVNYTQSTTADLNTYYILTNYADGVNTTGQYIKGTSASVSQNYNGTMQAWTDMGIGRQGNESWDGHIAEVIVFNQYLTENERGLVEDYLAAKYGTETPRVAGTTGPGGVGSKYGDSRLELWFDALDLDGDGVFEGSSESGLTGATVTAWIDKSGKDRNLTTGSATYSTANTGMNNLATVDFNGTSDYLQSANVSLADAGALEYFIAFDDGGFDGNTNALINWRDVGTSHGTGGFTAQGTNVGGLFRNRYFNGAWLNANTNGFDTTTPYIYNTSYGSSGLSHIRNGTTLSSNGTSVTLTSISAPFALGRNIDTGGNYFTAEVGETIVFSAQLNAAEKEIIQQYLSEKYGIALSGTDYYTGHSGAYIHEVQGIGTSDGSLDNSHVESKASSGLEIAMANSSFNVANEYVFTGYQVLTDGITTADLGSLTAEERFSRVWYLDETGTVDVTLTFDILEGTGNLVFPAGSGYVLLYSPTDPFVFEDWTADKGITPTIFDRYISFTVTSADLADGYYTVATTDASSNPLPIELAYFTARACDKKVCLDWRTITEINNDYFTVEKSSDTDHWISLADLPGAGTSNEIHTYDFVDELPWSGTSYYRLKQTDFNGSTTYSDIRSVVYTQISPIEIYPNPTGGQLIVAGQNIATHQVMIHDLTGNIVQLLPLEVQQNQLVYDFSTLPAGIYFVTLNTSGQIQTQKVIHTK